MVFGSILWTDLDEDRRGERLTAPACFRDLNLDQVIDAMTYGRHEYDLKPFFYTSLHDRETITYRQDVMRDLEDRRLLERVEAFANKMQRMRRYRELVGKLRYRYHVEGWFLEVVVVYVEAVTCLEHDLRQANLGSEGLLAFREYMTGYLDSDAFKTLRRETEALKADLSEIHYCVLIDGNRVTVRPYRGEADYAAEVEQVFATFQRGAAKDYRSQLNPAAGMNHVEAEILNIVAKLFPDVFQSLAAYYGKHRGYLDGAIRVFDREVQFYVAYLRYIETFRSAGLSFCCPEISTDDKSVSADGTFDIALAGRCIAEGDPVVCNDFCLKGQERTFVVSGPNQGGKTTFARMFGQLHYLANLGCPVPGRRARLYLFDGIYTHFEREEDIRDLRGKLQDDLVRIHAILDQATSDSIIILNEIFTSTTEVDAAYLSRKVMEQIVKLDLLCVWVSFVDELATMSEKTVSVASTVDAEDPSLRTYKIVRKPADGLAYAVSIARKHRLTYEHLKERVQE